MRGDQLGESRSSDSFVVLIADVILAFLWLGLATATTLFPAESPVRVFTGLTTLLVLPGYALTTAVFPAAKTDQSDVPTTRDTGVRNIFTFAEGKSGAAAITGVERAALSVGLSLASLPVIGFIAELAFASYGLEPLLIILTGFLITMFAIGIVRRSGLPPDERYALPLGTWLGAGRSALTQSDGMDYALNIGLAIAVVLSMSMVGVALVAPQDGNQYTEVFLLAQQPDGEWAARNYPTEMRVGEETPIMVAVSNKEDTEVDYTVVVVLQRLADDGAVIEHRELRRFDQRVSPGKTWREPHQITPPMSGDQLRLAYLVYRGDPPSDPHAENAYRKVSFRVVVES